MDKEQQPAPLTTEPRLDLGRETTSVGEHLQCRYVVFTLYTRGTKPFLTRALQCKKLHVLVPSQKPGGAGELVLPREQCSHCSVTGYPNNLRSNYLFVVFESNVVKPFGELVVVCVLFVVQVLHLTV